MRHHRFLAAIAILSLLTACGGENVPVQITPGQNTENGSGNGNGNGNGNSGQEVVATAITLDKHEIIIEKGSYETLAVSFTPENTTDKQLGWVSLNKEVATVDGGLVVGVAPGVADIIVNHGNLTDKCQVTVVVSATSVSLDRAELTLYFGETATLKATVLPEDTTDELEWSSSDKTVATVQDGVVSAVAEGSATITAKAGEKTATCIVTVESKMKAVDLGLSVKWAECNIGAEKPEGFGKHYAWGEIKTKSQYNWSTYKWGKSTSLTKYNTSSSLGTVDNKLVLDPEDDVAHVMLGGNWRMPTEEEWEELLNNCNWEVTRVNGIKGYEVTASNGNRIFLPGTSYRENDRHYPGGFNYYFSSSLYKWDNTCAIGLCFYLDDSSILQTCVSYRYLGLSVRPVTE